MPFKHLALLLALVIAAAAVTIWLGMLAAPALGLPQSAMALVPLALLAIVLVRLLRGRSRQK
jgi:membrane protein implicated in regulation of membrane protease activity